jgi:hypothetical protein
MSRVRTHQSVEDFVFSAVGNGEPHTPLHVLEQVRF